MHVGSDVEINHSFPIGWIGLAQPFVEIWHVSHRIAAMWINLRAHHWVMRSHQDKLVRVVLSDRLNLILDCFFHNLVLSICSDFVYLKERVEENEISPIFKAIGLDSFVSPEFCSEVTNDETIFE